MEIIPLLLKEMEEEAVTTRKMLSRVPADKFDWRPHPKSMSLKNLATHIAEIPAWVAMTMTTDGLDFATMDYTPTPVADTDELLALHEKSFADGHGKLAAAAEADLLPGWTMRNGDHVISVRTKYEVIRMSYSQIVHHRAQLGVFLRLLDVPIPGSYGPSADDQSF